MTQQDDLLSVVVPMKDESANVQAMYERVRDALTNHMAWELILVDDGSTDDTYLKLKQIAAADDRVKVIRLRRNFGQSSATQAGIDAAFGNYIATLDGDLQNDPADLPKMLEKIHEGYDVVLGERVRRQDGWFIRKLPSRMANWLIRKVTKLPFRDFGCATRVMKAEIAHSLRLYGEMHRFLPVLARNAGALMTQMPVNHHARTAGKSKYGLGRTGRVILDLITIRFLSGYFNRPMHFLGGAGLLVFLLSAFSLATTVAMKLGITGERIDMTGNPLLLLAVAFFLMGLQLISMGLLGEVLVRTYYESQNKRPYTVRESMNLDLSMPHIHHNLRAA